MKRKSDTLEKRTLMHHGYTIQYGDLTFQKETTTGDGWCLFRAMCASLGLITLEEAKSISVPVEVKEMKEKVIDRLKNTTNLSYMVGDLEVKVAHKEIQDELKHLQSLTSESPPNEWPTDISLRVIADNKNLSIVILRPGDDYQNITRIGTSDNIIYLYHSGMQQGSAHYSYLTQVEEQLYDLGVNHWLIRFSKTLSDGDSCSLF